MSLYKIPFEDLLEAYYSSRKHKRNTISQLKFEINLEENLSILLRDLRTGNYVVGSSVCFMIEDPVKREIFAADFRDRIVHHLIYNYISPIFEKHFIYDSYSCRLGKGTLFGIKRLDHHIRSCSDNYKKSTYVLKLDIEGYFMNINRELLYQKVRKVLDRHAVSFDRDFVNNTIRDIAYNEPIINCRIKGRLSDWNDLPKSKSLFCTASGCGIPIGNLTSQLFSNIYLNEFDHFMKRTLGLKHYGRYVDDFFVVHTDKVYLKSLIPQVRAYLKEELGLVLHPKKIVLQGISKGVKYLGAFIKPRCITVDKRTLKKIFLFYEVAEKLKSKHVASGRELAESYRATINSYMGILGHYKSYNLKKRLICNYQFPYAYGYYFLQNRRCRLMISHQNL